VMKKTIWPPGMLLQFNTLGRGVQTIPVQKSRAAVESDIVKAPAQITH